MVEDVIDVEARHPHVDAVERQSFERIGIDALAQVDVVNLIVVARVVVEHVGTYLGTIQTGVDAQPLGRGEVEVDVAQFERIA